MPVVNTEIISQGDFSDGIHLQLKLTDQHGVSYSFSNKLPHGADINAFIAAKVAKVDANLIREDLRKAVYQASWDYQLQHATLTQLRDYVRQQYLEVKFWDKNKQRVKVARRIVEWIENGRFTVAQLRDAFGLDDAQFTTLRNKMIALRDADDLIKNAEGE